MSRHLARQLGTALAAALVAAPAWAETRSVTGHALNLVSAGDETVRIITDPSLPDSIVLSSKEGSLDCAEMSPGGSITLPSCLDDAGALTLRIPSGTPITIDHKGGGDIIVGGDSSGLAPLRVTQSGSGDMAVSRAAVADVALSGSGDFRIGEVQGPVSLTIDGSGDAVVGTARAALRIEGRASGGVVVGAAELGDAEIALSGSGDVMIGSGQIGHLSARTAGSGNIVVAASVNAAEVTSTGDGDIRLARTTGPVQQRSTGSGTIKLGGSDIVNSVLGRVGEAMSSKQFAAVLDPDVNQKLADANRQLADASQRVAEAGRQLELKRSRRSHADDGDLSVQIGQKGSTVHHILAGLMLAALLFWGWRILQRHGGIAALRGRRAGISAAPAAPTHPGVLALRETMVRLDQRLARVEGYVTSREFELQREFRALDRGQAR